MLIYNNREKIRNNWAAAGFDSSDEIKSSDTNVLNLSGCSIKNKLSFNTTMIRNKYTQIKILIAAGLPAPKTSIKPFKNSVTKIMWRNPGRKYYQEKINKVAEYRVIVSNNLFKNIIAKKELINKNAFEWKSENVTFNYDADLSYKKEMLFTLCLQAIAILNFDFAGIDIIEDITGKFYIIDVNTAPGIAVENIKRLIY